MEEAHRLANDRNNVNVQNLDVSNGTALSALVKGHDVVIRYCKFCRSKKNTENSNLSFVPAQMHHIVAQHCLNHRVPLITASYVSPSMAELDEA